MFSPKMRFASRGTILAASPFLLLAGCRSEKEKAAPADAPADVAVVAAHRGDIRQDLTVAGIFQPFQDVDVHGKVSGYIRKIYVDIGDRVKQGQTLAVLEVPELQAEVTGAEAGITASQQQIARLQSDVARAQANYAAAHANYTRLKQASDQQPGLVAEQELDNVRAQDLAAQAQIDAAKAAVAAGQGQLGVSRADRLRVSTMAQYANITAPFNGVVTQRYADTGALIPAGTSASNGQAVVRLAQSDMLRLRMPVPEANIPLIHLGDTVMVHVQATGQQFPGKIVRFDRDVSNATRTMTCEVDVPNPSLQLTPGMYADVTFHLQQGEDSLLIPSAAIIQGDQPSVMVVGPDGRVERREVVLGIGSANEQAVTSGLQSGDQVIVGGLETLQPGEKVHAVPAAHDLVTYHHEITSRPKATAPAQTTGGK